MSDPDFDTDDDAHDEPSRSQRRREALAVFDLAERLVNLTQTQLEQLSLDDDLLAAIMHTRRITQHIARKREIQFLAKLMRRRDDEELDRLRGALDHDRNLSRRDTAELHRLEDWRERLIEQGDDALSQLLEKFPRADRQHLRTLARQARVERNENRTPHAFRELFRELRELFAAHEEDE